MKETASFVHKYLRPSKKFPHIWCPGCGIGIFMQALIRVIDRAEYNKDDIVLISGIGCSGRLPVYVDFNTLHTTHGRALTFATGLKLVKPRLKVITVMGDGDAVAIGGNHFIHAARRNVEIAQLLRFLHCNGIVFLPFHHVYRRIKAQDTSGVGHALGDYFYHREPFFLKSLAYQFIQQRSMVNG